MRLLRTLKEWLFYGHVWIALAAAGLGWMSLQLAGYDVKLLPDLHVSVPLMLFFATFGIYTLHRLISFRKAKSLPATKRYRLVAKYPLFSLLTGMCSLILAASLAVVFLEAIWKTLVCAGFFTVFYLIPPLPGYRRLRDLPYVKVLWVAIAWTLVTHDIPLRMADHIISDSGLHLPQPSSYNYISEYIVRFLFTLCIALLFDLRDVELDKSQGVKTVANSFGRKVSPIVTVLLISSAVISFGYARTGVVPDPLSIALSLTYLVCLPLGIRTIDKRDEDWYAIVVNGMLLLPPIATAIVVGFS